MVGGLCRLCARILTALGSLHHSMESGHLRLGLCVVYRPLLEELRQDVAASLTALSGLVLGTLSGVAALEVCAALSSRLWHCPSKQPLQRRLTFPCSSIAQFEHRARWTSRRDFAVHSFHELNDHIFCPYSNP